jgi:TolB-like protein
MPHAPDRAGFLHGLRFLFEVLRWALHVAWMIFLRAPRWVRVVVTIWVVLTLLPLKCGRDSSKNPATAARPAPAETETPAEAAVKTAAREARKSGNAADLARIGNELARNFGVNVDGPGPGKKTVLLVPFAKLDSDEPADKFASAVFASLYGHLSLAHPRDVGLARPPPGGGPVDPARAGRGKAGGAGFVLSGEVTGEGEARALVVRLVAVAGGDVKWTATYPVALTDPTAVADQIATHIVAVIPRREPAKSK